ncbi:cytochrome P450 [Dissophora ornata]|nr:cytochrome P450 [Dissophora ornata]
MSMVIVWVGLKRMLDRQWAKRKRSPLEYVVLATLGFVIAATMKYPNRAILTRPRPDLKALGRDAPGYPLIGNLPDLFKHREDLSPMLHDVLREHGDVISLTLPVFGRVIVINRPEFMEHILKTNFENYVKGDMFRWTLTDILGRGIFVSDDEQWRFHRKTASNIFSTRLYRTLVEGSFKSSAHDLSRVLDRHMYTNTLVDLQAQFLKLTLDAFGKLTFGLEFQALSQQGSNEFGDAFDFLTASADARLSNPLWMITDRLIPSQFKKYRESIDTLDKYAAMAVSNRRTESPEEKEERPRDLLDYFINYRSEDGTMLTDRELRDIFVNFMVAGRDTTAQGLTWQFYCLMANPRVMNNIVQEIDHVLQGSEDRLRYEVLMNELPYTKAVLHETLRLHPPVPKNVKQAVNDDVLPDGTRVYKGDFIGYSNWCMGRNQAVWGVDAELFVPERWLIPDPENKSLFGKFKPESQFKFISFNAGPRLCLGQTFAILEAMVTTCILLQRYSFKLPPNHAVPAAKGSVTLPMKRPLLTIVARRDNGSIK